LAAEFRKVESEVGPIKYIAALIYGDNPDANLLESAVRWVIILIVAVFDPLALVLILAAQQSLRWAQEDRESLKPDPWVADVGEPPTPEEKANYEADDGPLSDDQIRQIRASADPHPPGWMFDKPVAEPSMLERYPYLTQPFAHFKGKPLVAKTEEPAQPLVVTNSKPADNVPVVVTTRNFTPEEMAAMDAVQTVPMKEVVEELVDPNTRIRTLNHKLVPDNDAVLTNSDFGLAFPFNPAKGDVFVRVDIMPTRVYKYNGDDWIMVDKNNTDSYISDDYTRYLISKIRTGEYNVEELTDAEADSVREYLKKNDN
jgi:hypothetical protein